MAKEVETSKKRSAPAAGKAQSKASSFNPLADGIRFVGSNLTPFLPHLIDVPVPSVVKDAGKSAVKAAN